MIDYIAQNAGVVGLLFFFLTFVAVGFWAFRPSNKQMIESYKFIPLSEEKDDLR